MQLKFPLIFFIALLLAPFGDVIAQAQPRPGIRVGTRKLNEKDTITICRGSSIQYFNEVSGPANTTITWRFNNGTPRTGTGTNINPILYNTGGIDTTWQVVSLGNFRDSIFVLVRVNDVFPIPNFTHSPNGECANEPMQFTNTTTGGTGFSYRWSFGDGRPVSTQTNPSHNYETDPDGPLLQPFTVKLIATNSGNCTDSITKTITVRRTPDPSIGPADVNFEFIESFNGVPTFRKCENTPFFNFAFQNRSSTISQNTQYTIRWGNGSADTTFSTWTTGFANAIKQTYPRGNSNMSVRVRDAEGCEGVRNYNVFVGTTPAGGFASRGNTSICAPNALTFAINNFENNAPGTLYRVTVNDNSEPQVFQHPAPNEVSHIFQNTSCFQTSSNGAINFDNSYRAVLDVENPCGTTSVSVIPIYVSGKPKAEFALSPSRNICVNSTITFTETNVYGGNIKPTGGSTSSCINVGKRAWSISPATGYTITGGSLGSLEGRPDNGFFWTEGSKDLNVLFTQTGTYRVKIYASNELCGVDSSEQEICVRIPPTASFNLSAKNGCAPATIDLNNTSPQGTCGGETYQWQIAYADLENCGTIGGYDLLDGTTLASRSPKIRFTSPGRYIITLRVNTVASNCATAVHIDTFFAAARPKVDLSNVNGICAGNALTPVASVTNCYGPGTPTYAWTFAGGTPATSTSLNPGPVAYGGNGTFNITLAATNGCGTTTGTKQVIIGPRPTANPGASREVCSGVNATLGVAPVAGVTYQWTPALGLSNPNVANPVFNYIFTGPADDTTITYTLRASTGPDCFSTNTVEVKVKKGPNLAVTPINATICTGGSAALTASGADTYTWSPAAGLSITNEATVVASPTGSTTYTVVGSLANGCTATRSASVGVTNFVPPNAGADKEYCSGGSTTIGVPSAGMSYSWLPATGLSNRFVANPTVNFVYTGTALDTTLVYVLTASNGVQCSSTDSVLVKVKRTPTIGVDPTSTIICIGNPTVLTASGADTYAWSPATGLSATNLPQVNASPNSTTNYIVTGTLSNGCSATATSTINVITRPAVSAGADTTACINTTVVQLRGTPAGGAWSGHPNLSNAGIFNPSAAGIGSYKVYYTFQLNGCDGIDSININVTNPPVVNAGRDTSYCAEDRTISLMGSPAGGRWGNTSSVSTNGIFSLANPGNYAVVYTIGSGACVNTDTVIIEVANSIDNNRLGTDFGICSGATPALLTGSAASAGAYAVSYQWQQSSDGVSWTDIAGATQQNYQPPALFTNTHYRRLASNPVCAVGVASNPILVFIHPNALATINPTPLISCPPFNITSGVMQLTDYPDRNGEYRWLVNNVFLGTGAQFPGYTIANGDDSVTITLVTISRFGCVNDTAAVQFKTISSPTPAFTLSDTVGCGPLDITITNTTPQADRYSFIWDFGNGQTSTAAQPGNILFGINPNRGDTIYTVSLRATGGCDTLLVQQQIRVRARPRTLFTPDKAEGCSPMTVTFNKNSAGSNAKFFWDFGDGSPRLPDTGVPVSHTFFTGVLDTFRVRLFGQNDCGTDTAQFALVVNPNQVRLDFAVNGNELNGCAPHTVNFINNTIGANLFRWNFGDGSAILTTNKGFDTIPHLYADTGTYTITLFATNGCSDTTTTEVVRVVEGPTVSFTLAPQTICLGDAITLTNTSETGLAWNWNFGDGSSSTQRQPAKQFTQAGTYRIVLRGTKQFAQGFGCTDSAVATLVVAAPAGDWRYRGGFYCERQSVSFEITNTNATQFRFYAGNGDSIITTNPNFTYTYPEPGSYLPRLVLVLNNCRLTLPTLDSIFVDKLQPGFTATASQVCGSTGVQFTDTSSAFHGIRSLRWLFGDGTQSVLRNPQKNYTANGIYTAQLHITGRSGCVDSVLVPVEVIVQAFPVVTLGGDTTACVDQAATFTANTPPPPATLTYTWQIAGGNPAAGATTTNTWFQPGSFRVQVIGRTAFGCADTAFRQIRVNPTPIVNAGRDITICRGQTTQLNATGAVNIAWTPQQGLSCSDCANPIASPNLTTQYLTTGTNAFGCSAIDTVVVNVAQPYHITITGNDTICASRNETAQLFASGAFRYQWSPAVGLSATNTPNPIATPASTTTYRVIGFDAENCFTDTAFVTVGVGYNPTVTLPAGGLVVAGTQVPLVPELTGGPFSRYTWTPDRDLSCNNCPNPVATINNNINYTLQVETIYGCTASDTTGYTVQCQQDQVYIPNAFSPDGDGVNDVLMVRGKGVARVKNFRIFNRFGQVVFEKSNFDANVAAHGWDGRINGVPASPDVYIYTAEVLCTAGASFVYKGNVTLFR